MKLLKHSTFFILAIVIISCSKPEYGEGTFGYDLALIKKHINPVILENEQAQIAVLCEWQGRVLTSTSQGMEGRSYGWLNYTALNGDSALTNFSAIGGECRLWFGPEAGEFSLFFEPGAKQIHDNVRLPSGLIEPKFKLERKSNSSVTYQGAINLVNYQNNSFDIDVSRTITVFNTLELKKYLGIAFQDNLSGMGYKIQTAMTNAGQSNWSFDKGLISLWDISTFQPTQNTIVIVPLRNTPDTVVSYFSKPGPDRMKIIDSTLYYRGDGQFLNKIGILHKHAKPIIGSYSLETGVLTIIKFTLSDSDSLYVNSHWGQQNDPYTGDVINVFNDGMIGDLGPFGPLYELESSSSVRALKVGESLSHEHAVFHFEGDKKTISRLSNQLLGVKIGQILGAL